MRRVAVLGDVHGNAVALSAVLEELLRETIDLVVWTGDLTWGWEPEETLALIRGLTRPSRYVRGNAERTLLELGHGTFAEPTETTTWMLEHHSREDLELASSFERFVTVEIDGLGDTFICHGSPRSDEELLTAGTPVERLTAATSEIEQRVLVSGHTHSQYDRCDAGLRAVNPGSVGLPYEDRPGAYWALLGPAVEHRRTEYDLDEAISRVQASGIPDPERFVEMLTTPPSPAEMIAHAEQLEFSG